MMIILAENLSLLSFEDFFQSRPPDNDNLAPISVAEFSPDEEAFPSGLLTLY